MTTVGLCVPQLGEHVDRGVLRDFCTSAEELGFAGLWVQEHLFYPLGDRTDYAGVPGQPIPAPYRSTLAATETLAAIAAWTETITIGTSVLVAGYHRPVELAQRLATLDVLSDGRLIAGFSVGWSDDEHEQMGTDPRTRGRRTTELIAALAACWGPDPVTFEGEFFHIPPAIVRPKPIQRPRPPLMSGMRSPAGLARTVALFDSWNPSRGTVSEVVTQLAMMQAVRPTGAAPLDVYYRAFLEPSVPDPTQPPPGLDGVAECVAQARSAGFTSVIVEANFWREMDSPQAWRGLPRRVHDACLTSAGSSTGRVGVAGRE